MVWFRLQIVDLYKLRSSGKGDCSTVQWPKRRKSIYTVVICSSLYLYKMHWMHSPGHPDLALNVSWQVYLNKTIYNFVEHNETRIASAKPLPEPILHSVGVFMLKMHQRRYF